MPHTYPWAKPKLLSLGVSFLSEWHHHVSRCLHQKAGILIPSLFLIVHYLHQVSHQDSTILSSKCTLTFSAWSPLHCHKFSKPSFYCSCNPPAYSWEGNPCKTHLLKAFCHPYINILNVMEFAFAFYLHVQVHFSSLSNLRVWVPSLLNFYFFRISCSFSPLNLHICYFLCFKQSLSSSHR